MTVSAVTPAEKLPVPVLEHPHWRVNFRPSVYIPNRLETLTDCIDVLQKTRVRLRGWDFPHVPSRENQLIFGDSWVAGWSDFMSHLEYWRFYQSSQFLYLGSVREVTEKEWAAKLRKAMRWHADDHVDIENVPGFLSLTECIYNVTEYFEFAARLTQAQIYVDPVTITISVKGIAGFMLATDENRGWSSDFVAHQDELHFAKSFAPADLISSAAEQALACTVWLFERFGWLKPNMDAIRNDQQKLLTRTF
jgi:hypothetical protein